MVATKVRTYDFRVNPVSRPDKRDSAPGHLYGRMAGNKTNITQGGDGMTDSAETLRRMLGRMLDIRRFEEAVYELHEEGAFSGHYHLYTGQEATGVAALDALEDSDPVFTTHRNHGHLIARGADANAALAMMVDQPLLIVRPLMQVGKERMAGFDVAKVQRWIGLEPVAPEEPDPEQTDLYALCPGLIDCCPGDTLRRTQEHKCVVRVVELVFLKQVV